MDSGFDFKNLSVDRINQYLTEIKNEVNATIDSIVNIDGARTFENTVQPLINVYTTTETRKECFGYAANFYPQKEMRDAGNDAQGEISKLFIDCMLRKDLYNAFKQYQTTTYESEKAKLTVEEIRSFEHSMRGFRRSGLELDDKVSEEVRELKKRLSDLCVEYSKNVNEENTHFEFTRMELNGLPDSWFTRERLRSKGEHDKDMDVFNVTLKYPDYIPAMEYVRSEKVRRILHRAYSTRCSKQNVPLLEEAVKIRHQIARKLGYATHADYKTEIKIVKSGYHALDFVNSLNEKFTPLYNSDIENLTKFAKEFKENPLKKDKLDPWDNTYYSRAYKEAICEVDMETIKEYFPYPVVKDGLFTIYQKLLGLTFTKVDTDNVWHEEVELYTVTDTTTSETIGYFYLDMHPREGKYSHAAVFDFRSGCDLRKVTKENHRQPHLVTMACNFPKGTGGTGGTGGTEGTNTSDGCISFNDVVTFFHEFGHVMHQICSKPQLGEFVGFGVEGDFIEAPSQMLENWCYCEESIQLMSSHIKTNNPLPINIINKLKKMKNVLTGYTNKRQLNYGMFDLAIHTTNFDNLDPSTPFDSTEIWQDVQERVMGYRNEEDLTPHSAFGHLMGGYDAGYYGYLRSETYATNMFYKWFKNGHVLDPNVGMRYRRKLLEPGSTKDGIELLTDFLGEEPDDTYFLIDKGLVIKET
jgi:Zn-dependent oligopeptidase